MSDIYDLSRSEVDDAVKQVQQELGVAAVIAVILDEQGQFTIHSCAEGNPSGTLAGKFRKGPPELRGYEIILNVLKAAVKTIDKCIREGSTNFNNMKP